ncbi:hypothetical protein, partial [Leuconostoc falkenbergense]
HHMKEHYNHIHVGHDHGLQAYGVGFLLAGGIQFATSHDWWSTLWHAFLSWGYIGYYIAEVVQKVIH